MCPYTKIDIKLHYNSSRILNIGFTDFEVAVPNILLFVFPFKSLKIFKALTVFKSFCHFRDTLHFAGVQVK